MVGSTTVLTQRAYLVRQETVKPADELVYRAALATRVPIGVLQSGAQLGRTTWNDGDQSTPVWTRSGMKPPDASLEPARNFSGRSGERRITRRRCLGVAMAAR